MQISATRSNGQIVGPLNGAVNISPTAPTLSGVLPATAGRVGSKDVLFSWRSNTTGTATIYVRAAGETDYTPHAMPASTSDSTFFSTTVELIPEGTYEWYGSFETGCGTTMIGNATSPRTFDRVVSISFDQRGYTYLIRDGYDLTTTSTGLPLQVRVRNDAATPLRVQINTETVYPDLILGFTGAGSKDAYLTLPANGGTATLTLHVFTQETTQQSYTLTLNMTSPDTTVTDSIPLTLQIVPPNLDVKLVNAVTDPRTLVTTADLRNDGDTLTDLDMQVLVTSSGLPADFALLPDIRHSYIQHGELIHVEIIPLHITDQTDSNTYTVQATSRAGAESVPITAAVNATAAISNVCGASGAPQTIAATCVALPGEITYNSSGWYCTNRPNIDIPIPWTLNSQVPITSVTAGMNFSAGGGVYSHSTELSFNNTSIGGGIVPDNPSLSFSVPLAAVLPGATYQTLNLRSLHTNIAHYVVGAGAFVTVRYGAYEQSACYSPQELEDASVFPCAATGGDCAADLTAGDLRVTRSGSNLTLTARIGNGGTVFTQPGVNVTFYDGDPELGANALQTVQTTQALNPGEFEDVSITVPIGTTALPLYIVADDRGDLLGSYAESNERNNIYHTRLYLTSDLTVSRVDTSGLVVNPHTLAAAGSVAADISTTVRVNNPFTVTFFEDVNGDAIYTAGVDAALASTDIAAIDPGVPVRATAAVSGSVRFADDLIYAFVDSTDTDPESAENNNIGASESCLASAGCAEARADLSASYPRRANQGDGSTIMTIRIGNGGGLSTPAGVSVAAYTGDPSAGGVLITSTLTTTTLAPGGYEDLQLILPADTQAIPVWVFVDNTNAVDETDELNNIDRSNIYVSNLPNTAPLVDLGADLVLTSPATAALNPTVSDDSLPAGLLEAQWSVVGGDASAVSFSAPGSVNTGAAFSAAGTYTLRLTVNDGELIGSDDLLVTYIVPPPAQVPQGNMQTQACIAAPLHQARINAPTSVILEAGYSLTNVSVFMWQSNNPNNYRTLAERLTPAPGDTLVTFDPTVLANDTYVIQVVGTDTTTNSIVSCGIGVYVTGENKLGRVTLNTIDLIVPVTGLPIAIGRTYDSLERDYVGDFGNGWALTIGSPRLEMDSANNVTLTMPDGRRRTFFFAPNGLLVPSPRPITFQSRVNMANSAPMAAACSPTPADSGSASLAISTARVSVSSTIKTPMEGSLSLAPMARCARSVT